MGNHKAKVMFRQGRGACQLASRHFGDVACLDDTDGLLWRGLLVATVSLVGVHRYQRLQKPHGRCHICDWQVLG